MITYTDSDHKYTADGKQYISATTIIKKFYFPTDWDDVAEKYAKKNGNTAEYWKAQWGSMGADACKIGSEFHKKKEETLIPGFIEIDSDTRQPLETNLSNLPDGDYAEMILWLQEYGVAGQSDRIIIETKGLKTYVDVLDYKTNKKIDLNSYKNFKTGHQMMQGPLKHLQCCNYNHYNLQLSLYAYILEQAGFIPRDLIIEHYPLRTPINLLTGEGGEVDYEQEPVIYKMKYLKKEIMDILKTYKQSKNK
jgi:hypothetical protein